MEVFHGSDNVAAQAIAAGRVDVSKGGGELGMGFYTGDYLWVAKSWAKNRFDDTAAVVSLEIHDDDYFALQPMLLSRTEALAERNRIKSAGTTRTHTFSVNVVWSPIVGTTRVDADQHKFESDTSQNLLNSSAVRKMAI